MLSTVSPTNTVPELHPGLHIHLVGINGAGISAIARVLLGQGYRVSGSDQQLGVFAQELAAAGATLYAGHAAEHIRGADLLVISSAIPADNPEVVAAQHAGRPVYKRADFLGALMADRIGIAVAGTHGKTTTAGLIASILLAAQLDPSLVMGGVLPDLGFNGRAGQGPYFVVEADEYDHMFLGLRPELVVITNVEYDHPDIYPTPEAYQAAFQAFAALTPAYGRLVVCADDPGAAQVGRQAAAAGVDVFTYGLTPGARLRAVDVRVNSIGGHDFVIVDEDETIGLARLRIPGRHNVRNALAAAAVALDVGVDFPALQQALAAFGGIGRRFQIAGEVNGVTVVDDYAHHPTEIRVTLAAARERFPGRRLWAVWQPHTYSRTRSLWQDFQTCFQAADRVVILDVYRSREQSDADVDMAQLAAEMGRPGVRHVGDMQAAAAYLLDRLYPDDVVVTLSAGDGNEIGRLVLQGLAGRHP